MPTLRVQNEQTPTEFHSILNCATGASASGSNSLEYLLVEYYEGTDLIFIGKIRNGFTPALRREIAAKFVGWKTSRCPFANLPEPANARLGEVITDEVLTAEVMKHIQSLRPKLVAQIEYTEWTAGHRVRRRRFVGLRMIKLRVR